MDTIDPHCAARLDEIPGYVYARADRLMAADLAELIDQLEHLAAYRAVDLWDERARIDDLDAICREIHAHTGILPDSAQPTRPTGHPAGDPDDESWQRARLVRSDPYSTARGWARGMPTETVRAQAAHDWDSLHEILDTLYRATDMATAEDVDTARIWHGLALQIDDRHTGLIETYHQRIGAAPVPQYGFIFPAPPLGRREPAQLPLGELVRERDLAPDYEPVDDLDATQHAADLAALDHEYARRASHKPDSHTRGDQAVPGQQRDHLTTADSEPTAREHQRQTVDTRTVDATTADEGEHTYLGVSRANNAGAALHRARLGLTTSQLALDEIHHQLSPSSGLQRRPATEVGRHQDARALGHGTLQPPRTLYRFHGLGP